MPEREMHAAHHMSDFEALMWNLDKDPRLSSTMGNLTILDRPVDLERLRRRMLRSVVAIPRLRQRVVPGFGRLAPPRWQPDENFDIDHHLRWISLGGSGSLERLHETVIKLVTDPFDRSRPLWEFTVIDGLAGGRAAMLQKLHHTLMDGESGLRISEQFVDFERNAAEPEPLEWPDERRPGTSLASTMTETATHVSRRLLGATHRSLNDVANSLRSPSEAARLGRQTVDVASSTLRQARLDQNRRSPLWTTRSLRRWFGTIDLALDEARRIAKAHDVSINDVFVTGAVGGAGAYHRARGVHVDDLRMAMPISTRRDRSAGGNMFGLSQTVVPAGPMTVTDRLHLVHELLDRTKAEAAVGAMDGVAGLVNLLPTSVVIRTGFRLAASVDFATSNLRAAPVDVFIAGARMVANYPVGPLSGTAFNLTTMSYCGTLNMGLVVDAEAIEEPSELRDDIEREYGELSASAD